MTVIVADLGATNARLAYLKKGHLSDIYQFSCDDFDSPAQLIECFMILYAPDAKYVLAGVPGVVVDNKVRWTNRAWSLEGQQLKRHLKLKDVILMNDLEVQGTALSKLKKKDFIFLQGEKLKSGPRVLVNVGTGLGSCLILGKEVFASEYGQTLIDEEKTLETMVSGPAFKKLYQLLNDQNAPISALKIAEEYHEGKTSAIRVYSLFYEKLARALTNLALTMRATGGVCLCGGILDEMTLKQTNFEELFRTHPKMGYFLKTIPLCYIGKKDFAFLGLKALAKKFGWS